MKLLVNNSNQNDNGDGNIINKKRWKRNCPDCQQELKYSLKRTFLYAENHKVICRRCSLKYTKIKQFKRTCPTCNNDVWYASKYQRDYSENTPCKNCSHIGVKYNTHPRIYSVKDLMRRCPTCGASVVYKSIYTKLRGDKLNRICQHCVGDLAITFRKPFSSETRQKMRINMINRLRKLWGSGLFPNYNSDACEYFDWINKWNNWNGQYATNIGEYYVGELGYWVDYYEPIENVVIEWDEPVHYDRYGNLKVKDVMRMNEIKNLLKCDFYRYNCRNKEMKKYE